MSALSQIILDYARTHKARRPRAAPKPIAVVDNIPARTQARIRAVEKRLAAVENRIAEAPADAAIPAIFALWNARPCFICYRKGACAHREIDVALAELQALQKAKP